MGVLWTKVKESLAREGVAEVAMATGRLPCAKMGAEYKPIDPRKLSAEDLLALLRELGGGPRLASLGQTAVQWTHAVPPLGVLTVAAVKRGDVVQARVFVSRRDEAPVRSEAESGILARGSVFDDAEPPSGTLGGALELDLGRGATPAAPPVAPPERIAELDDAPVLDVDAPVQPVARMRNTTGATFEPGPVGIASRGPASSAAPSAPAPPPGPPPSTLHAGSGLTDLMARAREVAASDLHVIAERPPLFRVGGDLQPEGVALPAARVETMLRAILPARLGESFERDGSADFAFEHPRLGRFRVNIVRQRTGLAGCFRIIPFELPTLESLGLPPAVASATHHHQGLIVLTGPTGHGKTTTLTALVNLINCETTHHVITVEDPVEFVHPRRKAMMSQREVGTHTRSFRSALKGSLREDPDVIVIGELRDTETVRIALAASETGHLVIGTMNTPSAAKTIDRLIDLFPPGDQAQVRMTLAGGLKLVMSQRLVPTADRRAVHAAVELLPGSVALWNLIRDNKTYQIPSLQQRGKALGIVRLDDSLLELVRAGKTDLESALPFAENADDLRSKVTALGAAPAPAPEKKAAEPGKGLRGVAGALFGKKGG